MTDYYVHHRVTAKPHQWRTVSDEIRTTGEAQLSASGGALYGVWRSQIGRPRDELTAITVWPDDASTSGAAELLCHGVSEIRDCVSEVMTPTLRPANPKPPLRQGNYAFRWFETPSPNWDEFLELCAGAWPNFESSYDSQVIGLWRCNVDGDTGHRSLLLTRRPDLAMWERSKIPSGEVEMEVRRKLNRRYELCDWTCVYTTTLLTATDVADSARWT